MFHPQLFQAVYVSSLAQLWGPKPWGYTVWEPGKTLWPANPNLVAWETLVAGSAIFLLTASVVIAFVLVRLLMRRSLRGVTAAPIRHPKNKPAAKRRSHLMDAPSSRVKLDENGRRVLPALGDDLERYRTR